MRFSTLDLQYASREKRRSWHDERNRQIKQKITALKSRIGQIDESRLNNWVRECIRLISVIEKQIEGEEIERSIADIMRLAGLHYGLERENFRQKERKRERR